MGRSRYAVKFALLLSSIYVLCFLEIISSAKSICRFSYIAICCLSILRQLDRINVDKVVNYIVSCKNLDGGFGCTPGGESHAGQSMSCIYHSIVAQSFTSY